MEILFTTIEDLFSENGVAFGLTIMSACFSILMVMLMNAVLQWTRGQIKANNNSSENIMAFAKQANQPIVDAFHSNLKELTSLNRGQMAHLSNIQTSVDDVSCTITSELTRQFALHRQRSREDLREIEVSLTKVLLENGFNGGTPKKKEDCKEALPLSLPSPATPAVTP